jgi:hypothetical protein
MADQREELKETQDLIQGLQERMLLLRREKEQAVDPAKIDSLNRFLRATALSLAEAAFKANTLGKELKELDERSTRAKFTLAAVGVAGALAFQQIAAGVLKTTSIGAPAEFELWQRATADLAAVIGQMVVPALEMLTQWTRNVADYILNLEPGTQKMILNFASFAVGLKLVATIAGPVLGAMVALKSGVVALNAVLGATGTGAILALLAGTLGLIARGDASGPFSRLAASLQKVGEAVLSLFATLEPILNFLADTVARLVEGLAWLLSNAPEAGGKSTGKTLARVGGGAAAGAAIGSVVPILGTALGGLLGGLGGLAADLLSSESAPGAAARRKSSVGAAPVQPTFLSGEALFKKTLEAGLMAGGKTTAERTADAAEKTATETKEIKEIEMAMNA